LDQAWTGYGVAGINVFDNALYNHSKRTINDHQQLRQILGWSRPRQPTDKSVIEHFNAVIQADFLPDLPGWTGSADDQEGSKRGEKSAIMTTSEFRELYFRWVVTIYSNKPGVDGRTPRQRWSQFYKNHGPTVCWTREKIALMRMTPHTLKFRASGGLLPNKLRYQSPELAALRAQLGHRASVEALIDEKDLSALLVKHPHSGALLRVPCVEDPAYVKDLTLRQQQLIVRQAREAGRKNPALADLIRARATLVQRTEECSASPKMRERRWAAQRGVSPMTGTVSAVDSSVSESNSPPKLVRMTDLEYAVQQLDQIPLDSSDDWECGEAV
jgi:hypothetical protein